MFKIMDVFIWILAILLMSVSFWQTNLGYSQLLGDGLSFIVALVVSAIMLFLLYLIQRSKRQGHSLRGLSWLYIFFATITFIANFNALYTRFMRKDIYMDEMKSIRAHYNKLQTDVNSRLTYILDPKTKQSVLSDMAQLKLQIKDPSNQGIGPKARMIIDEIEKKLGKKLTLLTPTSNTPAGYEDLANRMEQQIHDMMQTLSPEERKLQYEIAQTTLKWNKEIDRLLNASDEDIKRASREVIRKSIAEYNKLGHHAQDILGIGKYKFEPIHSDADNVGKIGYAFKHAVTNFGIHTMVVLLVCALLDYGVWIILLFINVEESSPKNRNASLYKKKGRTLV